MSKKQKHSRKIQLQKNHESTENQREKTLLNTSAFMANQIWLKPYIHLKNLKSEQ